MRTNNYRGRLFLNANELSWRRDLTAWHVITVPFDRKSLQKSYPIFEHAVPFFNSLFPCFSLILNCSIVNFCNNTDIIYVFYSLLAASEIEDENIVMYVGLIVAIFVFITVVIIIIILLRRKTQQNGVYDYCKPYTYTGIIHSAQRNTVKQIHVVKSSCSEPPSVLHT